MAVTAADKTAEAMHAANRAEEGAEDLSVHCRPDSADAASASSAESPDAGASPSILWQPCLPMRGLHLWHTMPC